LAETGPTDDLVTGDTAALHPFGPIIGHGLLPRETLPGP
jgi:hypothetical protein